MDFPTIFSGAEKNGFFHFFLTFSDSVSKYVENLLTGFFLLDFTNPMISGLFARHFLQIVKIQKKIQVIHTFHTVVNIPHGEKIGFPHFWGIAFENSR